ncbi:uncharacterized protein LOC135463852 isoform X1 [Liolophura sinensis]|uniref:uncharacterized protein LOC135463852 isoform X1 n=1 Tax=Liolophura sinensis TaxID=3198878 RepID=UPI0031592F2E
MGVSLERVQFKFASIIGELCSDPDVLSQFAVWLDLRLAEYKLKGAISLDCSGEEPNPLWLKGINKGKNKAVDDPVTPHRSNRTSRERARDPFPHHMTSPSQTEANPSPMERMSPEVVIKEEPSDIYPIQVHAHQNVNASFSSGSRRKRSAAETLTGDSWSQEIHDISSLSSSSSPKHKRLSSTGDSPSNQSLMSVIGGFHDNAEESTSKGDNSYNPLESSGNSASNATAMYQSDISPDFTAEPSCSFNQPSSSQDYDISIQDPAQQIQSESSENSSANDRCGDSSIRQVSPLRQTTGGPITWYREGGFYHSLEDKAESNRFRRSRIKNPETYPKARLSNLVYAVSGFETWLWSGPYNDKRWIFEIPPKTLDNYLTEFFTTIKRPSGADYKIDSFRSLRSNIERYLKECDYPESITRSHLFSQSQNAYANRTAQLSEKSREVQESTLSDIQL